MNLMSQKQIADALGYSQSLVSRVLNNRDPKVPAVTVRRIWDYAQEHGYRPRGIDFDLLLADRASTKVLGFVLRSPLRLTSCNPMYFHALEGMHAHLTRHGMGTVFLGTESEINPVSLARTLKRQQLLVGVVLMGEVKPEFLDPLTDAGKPVVSVAGRYPGKAHSVEGNLDHAAEYLVDHMFRLGHRRFGWIGSTHSVNRLSLHKQPLLKALGRRGLKLDERCSTDRAEPSRAEGHAAAMWLLEQNHQAPPTAIICFSAMMARGALNAIFQSGRHVPRDISVAAIDMTSICTEEPPGITSSSTPPEKLGAKAAQIVLSCDGNPDKPLVDAVIPVSLVVRETTGPAARPD